MTNLSLSLAVLLSSISYKKWSKSNFQINYKYFEIKAPTNGAANFYVVLYVRVPKFCNRYMGHAVEISKFYLSGECYKNHIRHVRMPKFCNWHMGHAVEISKFYLSGECYIFLHAYLSYSLTRVTKNRWRKKTDIPYGMSYAYNIRPRLHTGSIFFVICIALRLKFRKWRHFCRAAGPLFKEEDDQKWRHFRNLRQVQYKL